LEKEGCNAELKKDSKTIWRLELEDCDEVLNDITKHLGPYGRKYLEGHIFVHEKDSEATETSENTSFPEETQ
jgi:hypothetical protein